MSRVIGAVILLVILAACATSATPSAKDSGIQGTAIYGPTCPVEQAGKPPCQRPYSGTIVVHQGTKTVATTRSGADGSFRIVLAPGTYTVGSNGNGFPIVKPLDVTVRAHEFTTITVNFDSGIR